MKILAAALALTLLAACGPAAQAPEAPPVSARLMSPADYIARFYVEEPVWGSPDEKRDLFEPALADALIKDTSSPDEVGAVDFSFRCGCQDGDIANVTTTSVDTQGGAEVTAAFTLNDMPMTIVYRMLRTDDGYRIVDVSAPAQNGDQPWSLRKLLGLT